VERAQKHRWLVPLLIIIASCGTAGIFYHQLLSPYSDWPVPFVPLIPFAVLGYSVFWSNESRYIPSVCTLAVVYAAVSGLLLLEERRYASPADPDRDLIVPLVLTGVLPVKLVMAGIVVLAISLERRKLRKKA